MRGARLSFLVGWLTEIASKVEAIGWPEGEEERTELIKQSFYGQQLAKIKDRDFSVYRNVSDAGRRAAEDFNIRRPMNGVVIKRIAGRK